MTRDVLRQTAARWKFRGRPEKISGLATAYHECVRSPVEPVNICSYELDCSLTLVAVDDGFRRFAEENGASQLVPSALIGQPVLAFISDATTRQIYETLFNRLATLGEPVTFGIRCDSPAVRRFLELTISPHDRGFTVTTALIREEPSAAGQLFAAHEARGPHRLMAVCSWCKQIELDGEWLELEDAIPRLRLFEREHDPTITHGMCEPCLAKMTQLIDQL